MEKHTTRAPSGALLLFRVASIKQDDLEVVGNDDIACKHLSRFMRIPLGACFQRAVFSVVQNEVSRPKLICVQPASRAVLWLFS